MIVVIAVIVVVVMMVVVLWHVFVIAILCVTLTQGLSMVTHSVLHSTTRV